MSANRNDIRVGVITRELESPYKASECQFVGKMISGNEDNSLFGAVSADAEFTNCNFSLNVSKLNNIWLRAAVLTPILQNDKKLLLLRCHFINSFLDGSAQFGLIVTEIKGSALLNLTDSWSTNCRIENRDI